MGAQENKQTARDAYEAFVRGDAEGAMRDIDDSIEWTARGQNTLTGTYHGKQEVGGLWGKLIGGGFRIEPQEFIADGDKVIVRTVGSLGEEAIENVDVLTYDGAGKLVKFDTFGDPKAANRAFAG